MASAYVIAEEKKLIVELAEESLRFWRQRKASSEIEREFGPAHVTAPAWDDAESELCDDRIRKLEEIVKVYS